jgi:hypothetical protein
MAVFIPTQDFHHNTDFFPNPEVFGPERSNLDQKAGHDPKLIRIFGEKPPNFISQLFRIKQAQIMN